MLLSSYRKHLTPYNNFYKCWWSELFPSSILGITVYIPVGKITWEKAQDKRPSLYAVISHNISSNVVFKKVNSWNILNGVLLYLLLECEGSSPM